MICAICVGIAAVISGIILIGLAHVDDCGPMSGEY